MDLLHLCRLCLKSSGFHSDIFKEMISNKHLYQLINNICELRVYRSDGLPEHICLDCFQSIQEILSFKTRAKETEIALIRMMTRNWDMDSPREYIDAQDNTITEKETNAGDLLEVIIQSENDTDETAISDGKEESASLMDYTEKEIISPLKERSESQKILIKQEAEEEVEDNEDYVDSAFDHSTVNQIFIKEELIDLTENSQQNLKLSEDDFTESQFLKVRRLECHHCGVKKETKQDLAQHIEDIHNSTFDEDYTPNQEQRKGKKYNCSMCERRFDYKSKLESHMRKHTGDKPFQCDVCTFSFSERRDLKVHMRIHTGEKPYQCKVCDFSCSRSGTLTIHMRKHTGEKPFKCNVCTSSYSSSSSLNVHRRKHTGVKPFQCDVCEKKFNCKSKLKCHTLLHTGEKPFGCNICTFSCSRKGNLKDHMLTHTGEKPFHCDVCTFRCARKVHLKKHMRRHMKGKPFHCNVCSFSCSQSGDLKIHMQTHTGKKRFECSHCDYSCSQSGTLNVHMRKHTGEKPFKCNICGFSCSRSGNLKVHIRKHTGEKPFSCSVCSFNFTCSSGLIAHMRKHSGKKPVQ